MSGGLKPSFLLIFSVNILLFFIYARELFSLLILIFIRVDSFAYFTLLNDLLWLSNNRAELQQVSPRFKVVT